MAKYRKNLPQLSGKIFLTDGGIETTLIFLKGFELPNFSAFVLLENKIGIDALKDYYRPYLDIARSRGLGFILESPTWRANPDWGEKLGYTREKLSSANKGAMLLMQGLREEYENDKTKIVISCCIGPRRDGYKADVRMVAKEAQEYHSFQIGSIRDTAADMVTALTITYSEEAIGIVMATKEVGMPAVISFTVETDGNLPSGESVKEAILKVDAMTKGGPAYYMINCAYPTHFLKNLTGGEPYLTRIRGIRANASSKSHKELDESTELDYGNPAELGDLYKKLKSMMPHLNVIGGCCGTDNRHIGEICSALGLYKI